MKVRRAKRRRASDAPGVIGLDLSLTSSAAAWLPRDWDGDTSKVIVGGPWGYPLTEEATLEDQIDRCIAIANDVVRFACAHEHGAVFVENYAFSQASSSATTLRELGGIVKAAFRTSRIMSWAGARCVPIPVTASAARKTLLQKLPRAKVKDFVEDNVRRLKGDALYWNIDQIDAVVVANHGARLLGWTALSFPGK